MYTNDIFSSCFSLGFRNKKLTEIYKGIIFDNLKRYNFIFCCYILLLLIISSILLFQYKPKPQDDINAFCAVTYYAIGCIIFSVILTILNFIHRKNFAFLKLTCYLNGIFCFFAFSFFRYYIFVFLKLDLSIFYLMHFLEFISRIVLIFTGLLGFLDTLLMTFILIACLITFYSPIIPWWSELPYSFILYVIFSAFFVVFSYFISREKRKSFYYDYIIKKNIDWYENIFDKSSFGFLKISNDRVLFANRLMRSKLFFQPDSVNENLQENCNDEFKRKNTSLEVQNESFPDLIKELFSNTELTGIHIEGIPDLNTRFLDKIRVYYTSTTEENFLHLGVKTFLTHNNSSNEETTYEILYRHYTNNEDGKDYYEFIFNDITRTRETEMRNAEFKYKALFLAKVAHEFKNPLICISELVEKCNELSGEIKMNSTCLSDTIKECSLKIEENLNIINSLSKYLIILTKDLDYFSGTQLKGKNAIQVTSTNLSELLNFVYEVSKGLVIKFNKQNNLRFLMDKEENVPDYINTDEIKLKQVLINLCSNAIKFTNKGTITLGIRKEENHLNFIVEDTGIGMTEDRMEQVFKPFSADVNSKNLLGTGLGLTIVADITEMFGGPIQMSSIPSKGSKFWFKLPLDVESKQEDSHESEAEELRQVQMVSSPTRIRRVNTNQRNDHISLNVSCDTIKRDDIVFKFDYSKLIDLKEKRYNVIIADDDIFVRNSAVRVFLKVAKLLNLNLNITEVDDGIDILYHVYINNKTGISTDMIISDETMHYFNGSETCNILTQLSKENKISPICFNLVTAYDPSLLTIQNTFSKPMTLEIATTILKKLII